MSRIRNTLRMGAVVIATLCCGSLLPIPRDGQLQWIESVAAQDLPGIDKQVAWLIKDLNSPRWSVLRDAAVALGEIGPRAKAAVPELARALLAEKKVREAAQAALVKIGSTSVPSLRKAAADEDPVVQKIAIVSLGRIGTTAKDAVPDLVRALRKEGNSLRLEAVRALGLIGPAANAAADDLSAMLLGTEETVDLVSVDAVAIQPGNIFTPNPAHIPAVVYLPGDFYDSGRPALRGGLYIWVPEKKAWVYFGCPPVSDTPLVIEGVAYKQLRAVPDESYRQAMLKKFRHPYSVDLRETQGVVVYETEGFLFKGKDGVANVASLKAVAISPVGAGAPNQQRNPQMSYDAEDIYEDGSPAWRRGLYMWLPDKKQLVYLDTASQTERPLVIDGIAYENMRAVPDDSYQKSVLEIIRQPGKVNLRNSGGAVVQEERRLMVKLDDMKVDLGDLPVTAISQDGAGTPELSDNPQLAYSADDEFERSRPAWRRGLYMWLPDEKTWAYFGNTAKPDVRFVLEGIAYDNLRVLPDESYKLAAVEILSGRSHIDLKEARGILVDEGNKLMVRVRQLDPFKEGVAEMAKEALAKIGPAAVPALRKVVNAPGLENQIVAAKILGEIGPEAKEAAMDLVIAWTMALDGKTPDRFERYREVNEAFRLALAKIGRAADPTLKNALRSPDLAVRWATAHALVNGARYTRDLAPELLVALQDPAEIARLEALTALSDAIGEFGFYRHPLAYLFFVGDSEWVLKRTPLSLDSSKAAAAVPFLSDALAMDDAAVRWHASRVLAEIGVEALDAVKELTETTTDEISAVRQSSAYALGEIGAPAAKAIAGLADLLQDPNAKVREAAAWALGNIGPAGKDAMPGLVALFTDPNQPPPLRRTAALGITGCCPTDTAAVMHLNEALSDRNPLIVQAAALGLARSQVGQNESVSALIDAVNAIDVSGHCCPGKFI